MSKQTIPTGKSRISKSILVVDDETKILSVVQQFLEMLAFVVTTAKSTKQALSVLRDMIKFDLAISDYNLGKDNGITLLQKIKQKYPKTKTILMSGELTLSENEMIKLGIDTFLQKPFDLCELERAIQKVLRQE